MESARNIAAAQTKKLGEYVKPREYLSGEANLRVRNTSGKRYIYGEKRSMEMERLTRVIKGYGNDVIVYTQGKYTDTTAGEMEYKDVRNVMKHLCEYENTGLTPPEIMELQKRSTAKVPREICDEYGYFTCPNCGKAIYASDDFESHKFCLNCGQRIKWEN